MLLIDTKELKKVFMNSKKDENRGTRLKKVLNGYENENIKTNCAYHYS